MARRIRILACLALAVPLLGGPATALAPASGPNVLILQSLDAQAGPYAIPTRIFRQRFQSYSLRIPTILFARESFLNSGVLEPGDAGSLPTDSRILFREPTIWSRYRIWILLAGGLLAAQTVSIATMLLHRRRRRAAELASDRLSSRLITAHEDERSRLARELHDDLSQRLAGLSIDAAFLLSNHGTADQAETLKRMHAELARIGKDIHDMSYQLHPSIVGELGLLTALRTEVDRMRRQSACILEERIEDVDVTLPRDVSLCLYRIAQESLRNAAKHADASFISVTFRRDGGSLVLEVSDDGKGFDLTEPESGAGIGLVGMRERARLAKGSLKVISSPGRGTTIMARIPYGVPGNEQDQGAAR